MAGGGYKNINGSMGNTFTSENQPKVKGRKPTKMLTDLLTRELKAKKDIVIKGIAITDAKEGKEVSIRVPMPNKETIVQALLRQAAKGNINAIREVFDRTEGKPMQALDVSSQGKAINNMPILQIMPTKVVNAPELQDEPNLFADE
jgi:hypothetical protein